MTGVERIAAERRRQIEQEGWTPEHDDTAHMPGELCLAAQAYTEAAFFQGSDAAVIAKPPSYWPFGAEWWKPGVAPGSVIEHHHAIRMLEKAGALIAAEIDRLERLNSGKQTVSKTPPDRRCSGSQEV